jgi:putative transposase
MPRIPRVSLPGVPMHIVQRGNNRQACFFHPSNYAFYLETMFDSAARYQVDIHAYVLMTNHVHLLVTPAEKWGASRMMQLLGATYVARMNAIYGRTGSLWEGRYKSSLVESERYCLACYRYIELNPVRAGMCVHPKDYRWSSYRANALFADNPGLIPHPKWVALGENDRQRHAHYRELVNVGVDTERVDTIRFGVRKGQPTGSPQFKLEIEAALGRRLGSGHRGRPTEKREKRGQSPFPKKGKGL